MAAVDSNIKAFGSPDAIKHYLQLSGLQPAEAYAFEKYISKAASVLDIGVGGGRTTPFLAAKASHYVGVDYVKEMVDVCAKKFPQYNFYCVDAACLNMFENGSFDVVVFSYNGIDAIPTRNGRLKCLSEVFRVLKPGGIFIFSSHNARALLNLPNFDNAGIIRKALRFARAVLKSTALAIPLLRSGVFFSGAGYYFDPSHGGIRGYCSIPKLVERDVRSIGYQLIEVIDYLCRQNVSRLFIPWYYYIVAKPTTGPN